MTAAVMLTAPADMASLSASDLDRLAETPIVDILSHDDLARALTSPPFVLLASYDSVRSATESAPVACLNFRDISSATRTPELRLGRIYRAGKSAFIGVELAQMGIVTVYDLRSHKECLRDPHAGEKEMAGVEVVWYAPTSSLAEHFERTQKFNDEVSAERAAHNILVQSYLSILDSHKEILRRIILDVAQLPDAAAVDDKGNTAPPPAILLHCTAGKDRTGVTVALLASLAGCSPEGIAREYALTRIGIEPAREHLMKAMQATVPDFTVEDPRFRALSESRSEDMLAFLDAVNETYGGFEEYAKSILQLTSEQIDAAKKSLRASPV